MYYLREVGSDKLLYFLLIVLGIELLFALLIFKADVISPSVIVSAVMFVTAFFAVYANNNYWHYNMHWNSITLLISCIFIFILGDWVGRLLFAKRSMKSYTHSEIRISGLKTMAVLTFQVGTLIWHFKYVIDNVGALGALGQITRAYRFAVLGDYLKLSMPSLLSRFMTFSQYIAHIYIYIFIQNVVSSKKMKGNKRYLLPVAVFFLDSLVDGARGYLVNVFCAALVYLFILTQRKNGWKLKYNFKFMRIVVFAVAIGSIAFTALGGIVGRSTDTDFFYRIAHYFGGSIPLLDDYLNGTPVSSSVWGQMTFTALNTYVYRHFNIEACHYLRRLEFRYSNGISMGNIYTAIRPYYQDFGLMGAIILVFLFAFFFSVYYRKLKYKNMTANFDFPLLYFGFMANALFLFGFDDKFFSRFAVPSTITGLVFFWLIKCLLINVRIGYRGKIIIKRKLMRGG